MQVEQREDGKWLCTGKTFEYREQLKALGGRWQPDEKGWLLPSDADLAQVQQLALRAYQCMDGDAQAHEALLDTGPNAVLARDATFSGQTYACKDVLRSLGARWDGQQWVLEGDFDKRVLEQRLTHANLNWRYYAPNMRGMREKDAVVVKLKYDAEKHARLAAAYCKCGPAYTCDRCSYACCPQAEPWSEEQMHARWLIGVVYDCPVHGKTDYSYI